MNITIGIDPGTAAGCAIATVLGEDHLQSAGMLVGDLDKISPAAVLWMLQQTRDKVIDSAVFVCERPQVYRGLLQKGDPNDLIKVAMVGAECIGAIRQALLASAEHRVLYPQPFEWKRQLPKEVTTTRILSKLSPTELLVLKEAKRNTKASLMHNVYDAIGIALWGVGRKII